MGKHDRNKQEQPKPGPAFTMAPDTESVTEKPAAALPDEFYRQIGTHGTARVMARQHGLSGVGVIVEGVGGYFVQGGRLNKKGEIE